MHRKAIALLAATVAVLASPAFAQGGGGAGGGAGGSAGHSSSATTGSTGGSAGSSNSQQQSNSQQSSKANAIQEQTGAAVNGTKTAPSQSGDSTVSAPGVGVGHTSNGMAIGSPGSGLGSPEQPVDVRK
jgi:hypothetical protein